jgi:hypothetical protein
MILADLACWTTQRAASLPVAGSMAQLKRGFDCGLAPWLDFSTASNVMIDAIVGRLVISISRLKMRLSTVAIGAPWRPTDEPNVTRVTQP